MGRPERERRRKGKWHSTIVTDEVLREMREKMDEKITKPASGCWLRKDKTWSYWYWGITAGNPKVQYGAHRVAWILANGPIPDGMLVCHKCDVPECVNPDHLFIGTHKDNARDCASKGRSASWASWEMRGLCTPRKKQVDKSKHAVAC